MTKTTTLIIGANSEIAKALAKEVVSNNDSELMVLSRNNSFYKHPFFAETTQIDVNSYFEADISAAVKTIQTLSMAKTITRVFICHGVLHNKECQPEKRLEDFTPQAFTEVITANTVTPMLWLKHLTPILTSKNMTKIVFFNARVGSITDNNLGGWYSYRASKTALNMLLKSATIELKRRSKNIKLISFHPGTTDSPLSKPFQKNVAKGKLFSSKFVARQLLEITDLAPADNSLSYLDWKGETIPW